MFWFEKWLNQTNLFVSCWQKIQPVDSEYKEGREYVLQHFIKEGSYGEVHSAEDVNSGFKFAAKKVIYSILICIKTILYKSMYIILVFYVPSFSQRLPWRGSTVRRWVRGVPSDLLVWWSSLEWLERGLMSSFWWNTKLVNNPTIFPSHTAYVVDTNYSCCHLNSRNRWNQLSAQTCTVHGTWVDWVQVQKNTDVISVEMRKWVFLGCSKWLLTLLKECLSKLHQTCDANSLPDKHWYTWHIFPLSLNAGFFTSHNPEEKINQMLSVGKYY